MKEAVRGLGKISSKKSGPILEATLEASQNGLRGQKTVQNGIQAKLAELAKMLIERRNHLGKVGGGEWSRTTDLALMRRPL